MPVGDVRRVVTAALPRITAEEFRERQERLRARARERGLAGVLVWSRGSSTQDQYADVYYLSNFYSHYPAVPDADGRWRAKGFSGLVVPTDGPVTLVTDLASFRDDLTYVDRVITDQDVVGAAIRTLLQYVAKSDGPIGILGSAALSWRWHRDMVETIGDRFVSADDLGPELRLIKSAAEQSLLRAAGQVGVLGVEAIMDASVPGATEAEVAAAGFAAVLNAGGMVYGISLSTGPYAHFYSQSQPAPFDSRHELKEGDMARVDFYGSVDGYLFDFGRSRVVGREPDEVQQQLLDVSRDSVRAGVAAVRPGATLGDVARAADRAFADSAYTRSGTGLAPEFNSWGHSLGLNWEGPYIDADSDVVIEPGMCLAVEKRVALPGVGGATYEDNVLVTADGYENLTPARTDYGSS